MSTNENDKSNELPNADGINENLDDSSVTMADILKQQEEQEEEYAVVLGGSDAKCCSYSQGYVKRQALYACLTCTPEAKTDPEKRAGICLACSYHCHEHHELIELYTKRNFRCDCGNYKITISNKSKCNLDPTKDIENVNNLYNHNFSGVYCVCKRPYPDPEDEVDDSMIQCCVCEDWFHGRHLESTVPDEYEEIICGDCMNKNEILKYYFDVMVFENEPSQDKMEDTRMEGNCEQESNEDGPGSNILSVTECTKPVEKTLSKYKTGAAYWKTNWRARLCNCHDCNEIYKTLKIEFLLDTEDSVKHYEEKGKQSALYEHGMDALQSIDRTQLVDVLTEFNKMKEKLADFLKDFVDSQQVVTEDDIHRFFAQMRSEKKQEKENQQYFCR